MCKFLIQYRKKVFQAEGSVSGLALSTPSKKNGIIKLKYESRIVQI